MKPILCCLFLLLWVACSSLTEEASTVTSARKTGTCSGATGAGTSLRRFMLLSPMRSRVRSGERGDMGSGIGRVTT